MANDHEQSETASMSDRELVARFVSRRDEEAFREVVRRHGALVLGVCRRVLGEVHEAEDAFQATFLVLARDARKIRRRNSLACWLHGVAYRISRRAARRKYRPMGPLTADQPGGGPPVLEHIAQRNTQQLVDEELQRLPARERESLTLRYLEGYSNSEIADSLDISVSAVEGRVKRAKDRLRRQLLRRGISLSVFLETLAESADSARALESLIPHAVRSGLAAAAGEASGSSVAEEMALNEIGEMAMSIKQISALVATSALLSIGLGLYGPSGHAAGQESSDGRVQVAAADSENPSEPAVSITSHDPFSAEDARPEAAVPATARPAETATVKRLKKAAEIADRLSEEILLEFNEAPLQEVAEFLATSSNIPIVLDDHELEDIGIARDVPITCSLNGVSLRSALRLILEPLDLDYVVRNEVLMITTREAAQDHLDPRVYKVEGTFELQELTELILSMVAADTWQEAGGTAAIKTMGDKYLVISQTDSVHDQIAEFLEKLRIATVE